MKYIIDVPDGYVLNSQLSIPWTFGENQTKNWMYTGLVAKPYDELCQKQSQNEVWDFVRCLSQDMVANDRYSCFGKSSTLSIIKDFSFQEAKEKYETWLRAKQEKLHINVGDEVEHNRSGVLGFVTKIDSSGANIVWKDGRTGYIAFEDINKTGHHFDSLDDILKIMNDKQRF